MKVLINRSYGDIRLTRAIYDALGAPWPDNATGWGRANDQTRPKNGDFGINSTDPHAWRYDARLIATVEKIGLEKSAGRDVELMIVDIPDGVDWEIWDYDGKESVHEKHRFWPAERDF